jgi:hypothetical protein
MGKFICSGAIAALAVVASLHAAAAPTLLYDQSDFGIGTGPEAAQLLSANDFVLAAPATVSGFRVWMRDGNAAFGGGDGVADGVFRSFSGTLSWYFFADAADAPGALIASGNAVAPALVDTGFDTALDIEDIFELSVTLPVEIALEAGRGWFGVREGVVGSAYDGTSITWMAATSSQGAGRYTFFDGANLDELEGPAPIDAAFQLVGRAVPEPTSLALLAAAGLAALALRRPLLRGCRRRPRGACCRRHAVRLRAHRLPHLRRRAVDLPLDGHKFLGGSHMLDCEIPPKSNAGNFDGISRIGSYKSGVD